MEKEKYWWYNKRVETNIAKIKKKAVPIFKKSGVARSAVFGSVARGEAKKNSDIDFLVEFEGKKHYLISPAWKLCLKTRWKKKVDVITYNALHPLLKDYISKDQKLIYEKKRGYIRPTHTGQRWTDRKVYEWTFLWNYAQLGL